MNFSIVFLVLSAIGLMLSSLAFFRVRISGRLTVPTFMIGWLRGEMALQTIAVEALVVLFIAQSGNTLATDAGTAGIVLCLISWGLLLATHRRGLQAGEEIAAALAPMEIRTDQAVSAFHGFPNPFRYGHGDVHRICDL